MQQSWCVLLSLSFILLLSLCSISRADLEVVADSEVAADSGAVAESEVVADAAVAESDHAQPIEQSSEEVKEKEEEKCDVRMNGECFEDLEEATHALSLGRQAGRPQKPQGSSAKFHWSPKRVVIELKSGTTHRGSFVLRADRNLKSLIITTSGSGRAIIDCENNGKAGLTFENVINSTTLAKLDVRRCSPALHFTPSFAGQEILVRRSHFHGNPPDPVHQVMALLIESDKPFDHHDNGLPLRYTDAHVREIWLSESEGLTQFPMQLSREDQGLIERLNVVVRDSQFREELQPEGSLPDKPGEAMMDWDNGMDYYLNKIYKKVGVKTDRYMMRGKTHMLAQRRISGHGLDSVWDLTPPFRPNEVNHNSPAFRRMLSQNGIY